VRVAFDENTPRAVAHALRALAVADTIGSAEPIEVLHALDLVERGTPDVTLIQAVADGTHTKAVLITTDKAMRTRQHERAAFADTGCIGIVLRGRWNHASLWDRARLSLLWWPIWVQQIQAAQPGTMWQCPWSERPKLLKPF
jgi:PIN like domain